MDEKEGRCFLVFEVDEDFEDRMSTEEEILESKAKIYPSFLSRICDVVMIMSIILRQDEN